jgi:hypothetical protein
MPGLPPLPISRPPVSEAPGRRTKRACLTCQRKKLKVRTGSATALPFRFASLALEDAIGLKLNGETSVQRPAALHDLCLAQLLLRLRIPLPRQVPRKGKGSPRNFKSCFPPRGEQAITPNGECLCSARARVRTRNVQPIPNDAPKLDTGTRVSSE